jgi:hypothetical protein
VPSASNIDEDLIATRDVGHAKVVRCPDCRKRLFDLELQESSSFRLLIVCRCRQRFRIELPNPATGNSKSPLLVRA